MRTALFTFITILSVACDQDPAVQLRSLPGPEICDALSQVCPLGEQPCVEMQLACGQGAVCKACAKVHDVSDPAMEADLQAVCESFEVYAACGMTCA